MRFLGRASSTFPGFLPFLHCPEQRRLCSKVSIITPFLSVLMQGEDP